MTARTARGTPAASEPALEDVQQDYPHWRCYQGTNWLYYATHTATGTQVRGEDPLDLRDQIRGAESRHGLAEPAPGLPPRQGAVLAVLWDAPGPLTAAQITARLGGTSPARTGHALARLHTAGLAVPARDRRTSRWRPVQSRDDYLATLIAAALGQAGNPAAVLRAVLGIPAHL